MINNTSMKDQQKLSTVDPAESRSASPQDRKPNEQTGFYFSGSLKITDPESGEVIVQMRAD
jgi:hypothetical protein